ncbi:hypothetical protein QFZ35_003128 [Arthrobacter ulcerisalmonis]|nr:hypothetical protein [Arthrobacter ulcerisalmonis]
MSVETIWIWCLAVKIERESCIPIARVTSRTMRQVPVQSVYWTTQVTNLLRLVTWDPLNSLRSELDGEG